MIFETKVKSFLENGNFTNVYIRGSDDIQTETDRQADINNQTQANRQTDRDREREREKQMKCCNFVI